MTVSSTTSRADYNGNGVTTAFSVPFYFLDNTHVQVLYTNATTGVVATWALNSDYTLSGAGVAAGGTLTATVAPASGYKLSVLRNIPVLQSTHYVPNDPFPAASHEQALDKLTMIAQQQGESISRALTLPAQTTGVSTALPAPLANQLVGWNSGATGLTNIDPASLLTIAGSSGFSDQLFSGDGSTTDFTLSAQPGATANLKVSVGGVQQYPPANWTLSGNTLTFTAAPANGVTIYANWGQTLGIGVPSDASVTAAKLTTAAIADAVHSYTSKATPVDADELFAVDSAASNGPKKLTWTNVKAGIFSAWGALVSAGTAKTSLVDADAFAVMDSAASNATKKTTVANLKSAIVGGSNQYVQFNDSGVFGGDVNFSYNKTTGVLRIGGTTQFSTEKLSVENATSAETVAYFKNNGGATAPTMSMWNAVASGNNLFTNYLTEAAGSATVRGSIDYNRGGGVLRFNTSSDAKLKNLIGDADVSRSLEILDQTRLREYTWKHDVEQRKQVGVIAQELFETFPGAVSVGGEYEEVIPAVMSDDGEVVQPESREIKYQPWAVDKTAFTFHLIAGYQEQKRQIEELKARVAALETK